VFRAVKKAPYIGGACLLHTSHPAGRSNYPREVSMPKGWSNKDERKYEHIKESAQERGASTKRAKEIAARTVNRDRRESGRTPNRTTQGTGNPNRNYEDRSVEELRNIASDLKIEGRSRMRKSELIDAIRERR
jgi:hypothetical protein